MEITINLDREDWKNYQKYIDRELPKSVKSTFKSFLSNLVLWFFLALGFMFVFQHVGAFDWPTAITVGVVFLIFFALFIINMLKIKKAYEPSEKGVFVGKHKFIFNEEGIVSSGNGYEGNHSWQIIKKIVRSDGMIILFLDTAFAFIFPEKKLDNPDELYRYIEEKFDKYHSA